MADKKEYRVRAVYPGSKLTYGGRMHIQQGHGGFIDPDGSGQIWRNGDLQGGLEVTAEAHFSEPKIETGDVTTCCVATATDRRGRTVMVHSRFPDDLEALLAYGVDQLDEISEVVLDNFMPESTQAKYTESAQNVLQRRQRNSRVTQRQNPQRPQSIHRVRS